MRSITQLTTSALGAIVGEAEGDSLGGPDAVKHAIFSGSLSTPAQHSARPQTGGGNSLPLFNSFHTSHESVFPSQKQSASDRPSPSARQLKTVHPERQTVSETVLGEKHPPMVFASHTAATAETQSGEKSLLKKHWHVFWDAAAACSERTMNENQKGVGMCGI